MTFGWSRPHPPMRVPERHRTVTPDRTEYGVSSGSRDGKWTLPAMACGGLVLLLVVAGSGHQRRLVDGRSRGCVGSRHGCLSGVVRSPRTPRAVHRQGGC